MTSQGAWGEVRGVCDGPYTEVGAYVLVEFTAVARPLAAISQKASTFYLGNNQGSKGDQKYSGYSTICQDGLQS